MSDPATILLTSASGQLRNKLLLRRPDWHVVELRDGPPRTMPTEQAWAFVDWLLPDISGLELCRRLRGAACTRGAHLTMVLDSDSREARLRSLEAGADDYLSGPLTIETLLDRVEGLHTPTANSSQKSLLKHGELLLDPAAHQVRYKSKLVVLRPNEFKLLVHFVENPDQVFSRTGLIDRLGKDVHGIDERTVDVWIGRLRRSLRAQGAPDPLRTVRSLGYVLDSVSA